MNINFGTKVIGENNKAFVIAEVAQAHDGSLGYAHSFIDAASDAGVDAVKFQAHYAEHESTLDEPFRINFSYVDKSRYDYWKRMEFTEDQWVGLKKHAEAEGLVFLCTPFSSYAVDLLDNIGVVGWKIGSGEVDQKWLLNKIIQTKKPVILSTGMSQIETVDSIYQYFKKNEVDFSLLQCTSMYPTPLDKIGINVFEEYRKRYDVPIGLSNHSGSVWPSIYAIALGASIIEVHIKLNDFSFGPDTTSSLSVEQLKTMIDARNEFHTMALCNINKSEAFGSLTNNKDIFSRSITLDNSYKKGTILEAKMIVMKKPGTGMQETEIPNIIGKTLSRDYDCLHLLDVFDLENY